VRTRRLVLQDVDESAQGIADVEPAHAPRLTDRTVFDRKAGIFHSPEGLRKIIHLDRQVGTGVPEPPWLAKLTCTVIFDAEA